MYREMLSFARMESGRPPRVRRDNIVTKESITEMQLVVFHSKLGYEFGASKGSCTSLLTIYIHI